MGNKYRAFLRLILLLDQNQGQSWLAITVEVNLDQTGAAVIVIFLKESSVVILEVGQGDDCVTGCSRPFRRAIGRRTSTSWPSSFETI